MGRALEHGESMFLKEVQMENFKSFGRKIHVPFLPGFTAITGPNGSGKSNIGDAILFVLGPKSAKAIRAGRLTDLLWNGGEDKKRAASYCEVSLVFDNADRTMPVDTDEVKLTRRVNISASVEGGYNSYFYINEKKSSLNEFDQVLAQARISAEGYNLVQQGDVTKIVAMSVVERRRILDNVAGITKFDEDISSADGKRKAAEDGIERIKLILEEIGKQLKQLEVDKEGALKARTLQETLDTARSQMALKNRQLVEEAVASLEGQITKVRAEKEKLDADRVKLQMQAQEASTRLRELEAEIARRGGQKGQEVQQQLNDLKVRRATDDHTAENSRAEIKRLAQEATGIATERKKAEKDLAANLAEQTDSEKTAAEAEKSLITLEVEVKRVDAGMAGGDKKLGAMQKDSQRLAEIVSGLEEQAKTLSLESERQRLVREQLENEIGQLEGQAKSLKTDLEDAEFQLKDVRTGAQASGKSTKKIQEEIYASRNKESALAKQGSELEAAVLTLTREYERAKAQVEAAAYVQKGYTRAVMAILEARDKGTIKGIHGTIAELAKVESRLETAMNTAAGNRMQAIIVSDDAIAAECIDLLKSRKAGRAVFLPLNKMLSQRPRGKALLIAKETLGFALDLVKFDERYRDAFAYVFGDTLVVSTLEEARRHMGGIRLVTTGGELIEASGAMAGGNVDAAPLRFGESKGEPSEIAEKLRRAKEQAEKVAGEIAAIRATLHQLQDAFQKESTTSGTTEFKSGALEGTAKDLRGRMKALEADLQDRRTRAQAAVTAGDKASKELSRITADLVKARTEFESRRKAALEASPVEVQKKYRDLLTSKTSLSEEFHAANSKAEAAAASRKVLQDRAEELRLRFEANEDQRAAHEKAVKDLESGLQKLEQELRATQKTFDAMTKETAGLQAQKDEAFQSRTKLEGEVEKVQSRAHAKEDFALGLEKQLAEEKAALADAQRAAEGLKAVDIAKLPPLDTLKRTITDCEADLRMLGPINMKALETFEEQTQRKAQITSELRDLDQQRTDLLQLVKEITLKKKEGLMKVFTAVQENFRRVYTDLSGGGEADMILETDPDPFQGGLILKARPPGKKVLRLEALSGGEKSLVSLAFIFALQEYDPSPFYLLDEVDQNLDAVNAEKVAKMIKRTSVAAQTVQVSLRKISLKEADHLIGVTNLGGISEILMKVNLEDVVEEKPREEVAA